ncbi:hypothetical protein LCGC14_0273220 [marine sediment metagenome]
MKLVGLVAGIPTMYDGLYLVHYDPSTLEDTGSIVLSATADKAEAKRYPSLIELRAEWARSIGQRPDGRQDRPLTAFTIEIENAD